VAVLRNPESAYTKRICQFEMNPSEWTIGSNPGNPYIKGNTNPIGPDGRGAAGAEYPKMLYRAHRAPNGKLATMLAAPSNFGFRDKGEWELAQEQVRVFNESCQKTVRNEDEELKARGFGWRPTQAEALELGQAEQDNLGNERAERDYRDRNMSEKAKAEVEKFDASNFGHHPEVPEQPKARKKPGPKPKAKAQPEPVSA
jgi:hypothetical protein